MLGFWVFVFDELWNGTSLVSVNLFIFVRLDHVLGLGRYKWAWLGGEAGMSRVLPRPLIFSRQSLI